MGLRSLVPYALLLSTCLAQSETASSHCPATSVAGIPGCWGTPGCAYVLAANLGGGAMCEQNYCNCGGVPAPLLPTVIDGSSTVGCNYLTQPASSNCPTGTEPGPLPTQTDAGTTTTGGGSPSPSSGSGASVPSTGGGASGSSAGGDTHASAPSGATIVTGTIDGGSTITETFVPTTYTDFATLTTISLVVATVSDTTSTGTSGADTSTTVVALSPPVTSTITVGPSGIAWVPFDSSSGAPALPQPSILPGGIATLDPSSSGDQSPTTISSISSASGSTISASNTDAPVDPSESGNQPSSIPSSTSSSSSDAGPPPVITSFNNDILTVSSIDPSVTSNTAISTSDDSHPPGLYPFIRGGPGCFFCPPGVDNGGFFLWGMDKPGVYPPPVPPPVADVPWPTITIGPGNNPTPGPKPDPKDEPSQSETKSDECTTTTASSCDVSCTTPAGEATESCTTVTCTTTSGCSVTDAATTTTEEGACGTGWSNVKDGEEGSSGGDNGEEGPDPSYDGSVPAWVTAWPTETASASASDTATITSTGGDGPYCSPYQNPQKGESYCTCKDSHSYSFLDDKANCPQTSPTSGQIPQPTEAPPQTDGYGNVYNSTDIVAGTVWGCKSTSIQRDVAPVPITKCLESSSIGMAFTPTSSSPSSTDSPAPPQETDTKKQCDQCSTNMGASSCGPDDDKCLVNQCQNDQDCKACGTDCNSFVNPSNEATCSACSDDMGASSCAAVDTQCLLDECGANQNCKDCGTDCESFISGSLFRRRLEARPKQMSSKYSRRNVIQATPLMRLTAVGRSSSLVKRVEHKPSWIKFAPKGLRYYKMLQDKGMEDANDPKMCELDAYFEVRDLTKSAARAKNKLFEKIGITATKSYYAVTADGPAPGQAKNGEDEKIADFQNTISAEQGVFFANANDRGERKDGDKVTRKPIPYQMSTVAWWMWKKTVMADNPDKKEEELDFSNFKYFFRVNIDNPETTEILEEVLGDSTDPKDFTPEDESQDNAFWPLLGSPNGNTIAWFLADHKKSLNGKTIEKITAWFSGEDYFFWATIK